MPNTKTIYHESNLLLVKPNTKRLYIDSSFNGSLNMIPIWIEEIYVGKYAIIKDNLDFLPEGLKKITLFKKHQPFISYNFPKNCIVIVKPNYS